jgi:hypothetical protein
VLREATDEKALRSRLYDVMLGSSLPDFPTHPTPWGSAVVHDSAGKPFVDASGVVQQYFVDKNGRPVRNAAGHLMHFKLDEQGRPHRGGDGRFVLREVILKQDTYDHTGRSMKG